MPAFSAKFDKYLEIFELLISVTSSQLSSESELPGSDPVEPTSSLEQKEPSPSSPLSYLPCPITFFTAGFTTFRSRSARGLASRADEAATDAIVAVVTTT